MNILGGLGGDFIGGVGALDSHIFWGEPGIPFLVLLATPRSEDDGCTNFSRRFLSMNFLRSDVFIHKLVVALWMKCKTYLLKLHNIQELTAPPIAKFQDPAMVP